MIANNLLVTRFRVSLILVCGVSLLLVCNEYLSAQPGILINQFGYRPHDKKVAIVKDVVSKRFEVRNVQTHAVAFRGQIQPVGVRDENTGDFVFKLDFTDLTASGSYQLWIPGTEEMSNVFRISPDAYSPVCISALESYYYQRCGTGVDNGTRWKHPACHLDDAVFFDDPSRKKEVAGGWHDAGDHGKFVATAAISAAFLLYAYEARPQKFGDRQLNIPESGNGTPDILDEARWELSWLLKMQNDEGGIYHKVSTKKWTGEYLPHEDPDTRYIFRVSSTATGAFAAVAALGARIFEPWDKPFAHSLLKGSVSAWKFLDKNRGVVPPGGFRNPDGVEGGEYGDTQDEDERLWAAVELFRTTGSDEYHRYFVGRHRQLGGYTYSASWEHVQNLAYGSYLNIPAKEANFQARSFLIATLTNYCDDLIRRTEASGYRHALRPEQFYWGSNSLTASQAFELIQAYEATKLPQYRDAALDQVHYLLGRNTFGISFLTGVGANPVRNPYHQFSMMLRAGAPVPGLLVGGPNRNSRLRGRTISEYPGKCYEDVEKNYFVNEVAINYTAPFVYVLGYVSGSLPQNSQIVGSNGK